MPYSHSVITEIRRKMSGEFETPVKIGAEQRFVGAMINSHNNNLEEQYIMGVDRIVATWVNEKIRYTTIKYYDGNMSAASSGYYILFEQEADVEANSSYSPISSEFYFKDNNLYIPEYGKSGAKFDLESIDQYGNNIYTLTLDEPFGSESSRMYTYHSEDGSLEINPGFQVVKKDILCFRTDVYNKSDTRIESDILISEQNILQRSEENGKLITKFQIINHLGE